MKLVLAAVGRMKNGPERELLRRYMDRVSATGRAAGISAVVEFEIEESRARDAEQRRRNEGAGLRAKLPAGSAVLLLDERGRPRSSLDFARFVEEARDSGHPACALVVGGPDGLASNLRDDYQSMSFGAATFPHQLVRALVAEQMYRAVTILSGHPYHRE